MNKKNKKLLTLLSVLILAAAIGIVQHYIWGNAFITEFQSDCTDTLLWAQASLESGMLFKPTFSYAYRLAFGGQWLFMPFLKLFGVGMKALRAGMCLFTCLYTLALVLFFRSMHFGRSEAFSAGAVMLLSACVTKKMREIFFGHIIHYSLSVFYLLGAFILLRICLKQKKNAQKILPAILLTVWLFLCSANGTVQMLYVTLPFFAGCAAECWLKKDRKLVLVCLLTAAAAAAGFLFSRSLNTNYSDGYSVIVPAADWAENLLNFPKRWISLFYQLPVVKLDAFSSVWIKTALMIIIALFMLLGFCLSFSRHDSIRYEEQQIFVYTGWAMFAAFLFFFVFGKISDVDWRLIPLVSACEVTILILFRNAAAEGKRTVSRALTLICGLMLALNAAAGGSAALRIPYDEKIWFAEDGLLAALKRHDLDHGYITSYWLSNSITVLSDDTVHPRPVAWGKNGPYLNPFNSDIEWYDDRTGTERYYLAVKESEYDPESELAKEASETYSCFQEDTRNSRKENYVIMVLNRNIMKEDYDRLIDRYR